MSKPKRHHYLPQFYLEGFCRDGKVWVYDRKLEEYRRQTPVNTGLIKHYYTLTDKDGKKNADIESSLLSTIDGLTQPIIKKIDSRENISYEEKEILAIFIAFMYVRVPEWEQSINEMIDKIYKDINKMVFFSEESTLAVLKQSEIESGEMMEFTPDELSEHIQEMMDIVKNERYEVYFESNDRIKLMIELGFKVANIFRQMDWYFMYPKERTSFITSDNPFTNNPPPGYTSAIGIGLSGINVIPLSQKSCVMIYQQGEAIRHLELTSHHMFYINQVIAAHSYRFVLGGDKDLLKSIVTKTEVDKVSERKRWQDILNQ